MDSARAGFIAALGAFAALWHDPAPIITLAGVIVVVCTSGYFTMRYVDKQMEQIARDQERFMQNHLDRYHAEPTRASLDAVHKDAARDGV